MINTILYLLYMVIMVVLLVVFSLLLDCILQRIFYCGKRKCSNLQGEGQLFINESDKFLF